MNQLEKQSEIANLRQHHVVRQVALPYLAAKSPYLPMVKNPKTRIQDSFRITPTIESLVVFAISLHSLKISERFFHNFLSYLANTQTNKLWQKHNFFGGGNNANQSIS